MDAFLSSLVGLALSVAHLFRKLDRPAPARRNARSALEKRPRRAAALLLR